MMDKRLLEELKSLYRDGFPEENDEEADDFFSRIREENAVYVRENGVIVSAGYTTQKPAFLFGKTTHLPFLSGLATRSELRGQGRLREVLSLLFSQLYAQGESVCALYPFNHDYYLRHGFSNISFCTEKTVRDSCEWTGVGKVSPEDLKVFAGIESEFAKRFDNFLIYDEQQIASKIQTYSFSAAKLYRCQDAYCIAGQNRIYHYAVRNPAELFFDASTEGYSYCDFSGQDRPFAQGRIINAKKALEQAQYLPELKQSIVLQIIDPILCENNINVEVTVHNGRAAVRETTQCPQRILDIAALCDFIFCGDGQLTKRQKNYFGDLW